MVPELPEKLLGIDLEAEREDADEQTDEPEERVSVVCFSLGEHRLAIPVEDVRTTAEVPESVTAVPRTPPAIEGVSELRGEITAIVDPTVYFPTETEPDGETLLVIDCPEAYQTTALRIDAVTTVDTVPEDDIYESVDPDEPFDGDALEHPLVTALVDRLERHRRHGKTAAGPLSKSGAAANANAAVDESRPTHVREIRPLIDVDSLLAATDQLVSAE